MANAAEDVGTLPAHAVGELLLDAIHAREQCAREQEIARRMAFLDLVQDRSWLFGPEPLHPNDREYWGNIASLYQQIIDAAKEMQLSALAESAPPAWNAPPAWSPLPRWPATPQRPVGPRPLGAVAWRREAWEVLHPHPGGPLPELLYNGDAANPREVPLVIPAWARETFPELGDAIDRGLALRRAAGLPT